MLVSLFMAQVVFALSAAAALVLVPSTMFHHPGLQIFVGCLALLLVAAATLGTLHYIRGQRRHRLQAEHAADLIDVVLRTSREWLWAVDQQGLFTFSSAASHALLGYRPGELIGEPCALVMDAEDLARARQDVLSTSPSPDGAVWTGVIIRCRHRDGRPVWVDVSGRVRCANDGTPEGFEGTIRLLAPRTAREADAQHSRARIREIIGAKRLLTAFQPVRDLSSGRVAGVEALSRFVTDNGSGADYWFEEAAAVGLGTELEFAALETALESAADLPSCLYVALNISPASCLDPYLPVLLDRSNVPLHRIVLELTERLSVEDYEPLRSALGPLRRQGLRVAVDDAGSGFASMRHILHLRPDIIKLDRSLIAGIQDDTGQHALGAVMVEFAKQINAVLVAEGIETHAELAAVTELGMTAAQGYLLGRPSIQPKDWATWLPAETASPGTANPGRSRNDIATPYAGAAGGDPSE
ncbi:sensor domain-containing phosphodiesterase [Arthrobacter sp. 92]|uniref:sensor domain-containing phosphodiesterase n=1 Tax=Arthrobacter sp. 92 TaxID=3418175 RepID=UPI003CFE9F7F